MPLQSLLKSLHDGEFNLFPVPQVKISTSYYIPDRFVPFITIVIFSIVKPITLISMSHRSFIYFVYREGKKSIMKHSRFSFLFTCLPISCFFQERIF